MLFASDRGRRGASAKMLVTGLRSLFTRHSFAVHAMLGWYPRHMARLRRPRSTSVASTCLHTTTNLEANVRDTQNSCAYTVSTTRTTTPPVTRQNVIGQTRKCLPAAEVR